MVGEPVGQGPGRGSDDVPSSPWLCRCPPGRAEVAQLFLTVSPSPVPAQQPQQCPRGLGDSGVTVGGWDGGSPAAPEGSAVPCSGTEPKPAKSWGTGDSQSLESGKLQPRSGPVSVPSRGCSAVLALPARPLQGSGLHQLHPGVWGARQGLVAPTAQRWGGTEAAKHFQGQKYRQKVLPRAGGSARLT